MPNALNSRMPMADTQKVTFRTKRMNVIETVAELLVFARQQRGETTEAAARELQISPFYIEALERGDYAKLPCLIYSRNFVKQYGAFLGLHVPPLVRLFEQEWSLFEKMQPALIDVPRREPIRRSDFWKLPRVLRVSAAVGAVAMVVSYFGIGLYNLRQPPSLLVESPAEEQLLTKQLVQVRGKTEPSAEIMINKQMILSDADGNFHENVALLPGVNIIEIQARKKYSRESTVYRKIIVTEQPTITSDNVEPPIS